MRTVVQDSIAPEPGRGLSIEEGGSFPAEVKLIYPRWLVKIIQKCLAHYNQSLEIGTEKLVLETVIELPA